MKVIKALIKPNLYSKQKKSNYLLGIWYRQYISRSSQRYKSASEVVCSDEDESCCTVCVKEVGDVEID